MFSSPSPDGCSHPHQPSHQPSSTKAFPDPENQQSSLGFMTLWISFISFQPSLITDCFRKFQWWKLKTKTPVDSSRREHWLPSGGPREGNAGQACRDGTALPKHITLLAKVTHQLRNWSNTWGHSSRSAASGKERGSGFMSGAMWIIVTTGAHQSESKWDHLVPAHEGHSPSAPQIHVFHYGCLFMFISNMLNKGASFLMPIILISECEICCNHFRSWKRGRWGAV